MSERIGRTSVKAMLALVLGVVLQLDQAIAQEQPAATVSKPDKDAVERIYDCLVAGKEAVLLPGGIECKGYRQGGKFLQNAQPDMPLKIDLAKVCAGSEEGSQDWRKLPGNAIKKLVAHEKPAIDPLGIRVLGAIFCDELDLIGLDLPYSLVIDRSIFMKGFEARNFHTRADVSFDGSVALDTITFTRSRVDGSIYGEGAYIKKLLVLDSEVHGSLLFRESVLTEPAIFDTVSISGELSVRASALSYFFVQFSKIGGVLDLTGSQARCAYQIRKSEVGDLVAVDAGFGVSAAGQTPGAKDIFDWRAGPSPSDTVRAVLDSPNPDKSPQRHECNYWNIALPGAFLVSDTQVRSSLCLHSFHWLVSAQTSPLTSSIALNDLNVGATMVLDLAPVPPNPGDIGRVNSKLDAAGVKAHALIFNFDGKARANEMSLSGIGFEQVYHSAGIECEYDPGFLRPPPGSAQQRLANIPRSQLRLPRVDEVMSLLNSNCLATTQPFSAFVSVTQSAGNDSDTKELRIARATRELRARIDRLFGWADPSRCGTISKSNSTGSNSPQTDGGWSFMTVASDSVAVFFGSLLWLVADHGYRPEKVGWFVVATLIGSAAYFWLWVRVVGFMPAKKNTIRPIGLAFLFDRLLPAYKIREDHYDIDTFFVWVRKPGHLLNVKYMSYLWFKVPVVKAQQRDVQRAEMCLDFVKVIGLVLAIFLVAAINALFSH
jgi:hypothetical protein